MYQYFLRRENTVFGGEETKNVLKKIYVYNEKRNKGKIMGKRREKGEIFIGGKTIILGEKRKGGKIYIFKLVIIKPCE